MKAQIYVKSTDDYTSVVVSNDKGSVYFRDVLEVPELTGIQRGVSFVKHQLDADSTEIFPDKLNADEVLKDTFINYCKVNAIAGTNRNETADKYCTTELQAFLRWHFTKPQKTR